MRPPRFRVTPRQDLVGRLEENQNDIVDALLDPLAIKVRKDVREIVRAHIDDDRHLARVLVIAHFLQERLNKVNRKIVAAVEAEVLERRLNVALPRPGEAGDDDEIFGAAHSRVIPSAARDPFRKRGGDPSPSSRLRMTLKFRASRAQRGTTLLNVMDRDDILHEVRNEQPVALRVVADVGGRVDVLDDRLK